MTKDLNKRRVIEMIQAFYAGDIERALSLCSDDVDFFSNAPVDILPHLGHHRGSSGFEKSSTRPAGRGAGFHLADRRQSKGEHLKEQRPSLADLTRTAVEPFTPLLRLNNGPASVSDQDS